MAVSVLVPFAGDDEHRLRNLALVLERLAVEHPTWQRVVGSCEGEWCKAVAVADAASRADGDVFVVHDADVWCERTADAVEAVELGAPWAMPHGNVHRLAEGEGIGGSTAEKPYTGYAGGGIVVVARETWRQVPLDPRFRGWGQEDASWALALDVLAGPCVRLDGVLWHFWHPPQERESRVRGNSAGWQLYKRYRAARTDQAHMRALLEEVTWTRPIS